MIVKEFKMNKVYTDYVQLEDEIKALEIKKMMLRETILQDLNERGGKPVRIDQGLFSRVEFEVWEYSQTLSKTEKEANAKIKAIKDGVSQKKAWARVHGKAKLVDTKGSVRFTASKK